MQKVLDQTPPEKLAFVKRYERNTGFDVQRDRRWHVDGALWRYCVKRHRILCAAASKDEKPRTVPGNVQSDGDVGWWFPAEWVVDFEFMSASSPDKQQPRLRVMPMLRTDAGGGFPSVKEMRNWQLPLGSIVEAATSTVRYPDGSYESWGARRRLSAEKRERQAA